MMNENTDLSPQIKEALRLAALGYKVFPLAKGSKKPRKGSAGFRDATSDPDVIRQLWQSNSQNNLGLATKGLLVIDVDVVDGRQNPWLTEDRLRELTDAAAAVARTPRGGWHFCFGQPKQIALRNSAGKIAKNVDTRANGGYIVVAPSQTVSSRDSVAGHYRWEKRLTCSIYQLPEPPSWIAEACSGSADSQSSASKVSEPNSDDESLPIPAGERNTTLTSLAGKMRASGMTKSEISSALLALNQERCKPPLDDGEVKSISKSISRYSPGNAQRPPRQQIPRNGHEKTASADLPCLQYRPFPLDVLPQPVREYAIAASRAIGCDPAMIAVPLLVVCAGLIGNSRRIRLKSAWSEPAVLWAALVADSGDHKSPALEIVMRPIHELQRRRLREHEQAHREWRDNAMPQYEAALERWKKSHASTAAPPKRPPEPIPFRLTVDDITIEALADLLQKQPRGLILFKDELSGWWASFLRYRTSSASSDVSKWLEMQGAKHMIVDRKSGSTKSHCIPHAAVSVVGGIQPDTLRRCLDADMRATGLAARLLVVRPPRRRKAWSDADVSAETQLAIVDVFHKLLQLKMDSVEGDDPQPRVLGLTLDAKAEFVAFYNQHAEEQETLETELRSVWSKLEAYAPRLALVVHCIRAAAGDQSLVDSEYVDKDSMRAGITLARWFGHEARRVHTLFFETEEQREQRKLVEWIRRQGGTTTTSKMQEKISRFRSSAELAERALTALVNQGLGKWNVVKTQGRNRTEFQLNDQSMQDSPLANDASADSDQSNSARELGS